MGNWFTNKPIKFFQYFIPVLLATFITFVLGRFYEWGMVAFDHGPTALDFSYLTAGLLLDLQISFISAIPIWFFYKLAKKITPKFATGITATVITIIGICNVLLITYFSATLVPLGAEFWAYSVTEMTNTVVAAEQLSFWSLLTFVVISMLFYWVVKKILELPVDNFRKQILVGVPTLGIIVIGISQWIQLSGNKTFPDRQTNKLAYFVIHSVPTNNIWNSQNFHFDQNYPFLHQAEDKNVLGPYFYDTSSPPNIVFLLVESLGGEFVGKGGQWTGFAPYLDSLAQKGLYWENGLSLSGRTFGMVPSLLGSLPPGNNGFMDLGPNYPNHQTVISLLADQGYHTAFFSGYDTYFDNLDYFLEYQDIDFVLNKLKIERQFITQDKQSGQNYWGFDDKSMFKIASGILDTLSVSPRLEIYHTVQSHSPFKVPDPKEYKKKFNRRLAKISPSPSQRKAYQQYRSELTTLLYTDDSIQNFMEDYRQRKEYQNTIFIITGDHWLVPVPQTTQISRYHVPIIIYSPLLKKPVHFKSVNTHANIVPSLTSYLDQNTGLSMPDSVHWIGTSMDTVRSFRNIHSIPLMKNKNQLSDYLDGQYYLSGDQLFKITNQLQLVDTQSTDTKNKLRDGLNRFKTKNRYVVNDNKLYPGRNNLKKPDKYNFIVRYDTLFHRIDSAGMNPDEQFLLARQQAFDDNYEIARVIAKRLLMRFPDYHDVRLLLGRTYAWEGNYEQAREIFQQVLEMDPKYHDTYSALYDTEYWDGNHKKALEVIDKGLEYHPDREQFLEKKIRILADLYRHPEAQNIYNRLKKHYPDNDKLPSLKRYISE